jgi:hypothetical protein
VIASIVVVVVVVVVVATAAGRQVQKLMKMRQEVRPSGLFG